MNKRIEEISKESRLVLEAAARDNAAAIEAAVNEIVHSLQQGGKLLIFGNGGSAADSQHMAAEFIGRFQKERKSFPAIALTTDTSALTALGNDYGFHKVFSRQLEGLARRGDVAFGISTSGNSANVIEALDLAKKTGLKTISLTGHQGGKMAGIVDININVASEVTARIQESHAWVIHCICELVEGRLG